MLIFSSFPKVSFGEFSTGLPNSYASESYHFQVVTNFVYGARHVPEHKPFMNFRQKKSSQFLASMDEPLEGS